MNPASVSRKSPMLKSGLQTRIPGLCDASWYQAEFSDHLSASEGPGLPSLSRDWAVETSLSTPQSPELRLKYWARTAQRSMRDIWRTSFHPSASEEAPKSTSPTVFNFESINRFTSVSCVEERVGIVENGCTLGPKFCPSSMRPNLRLAVPRIHGQTGLARSNTGSDTCVQYALPDRGTEGAGS